MEIAQGVIQEFNEGGKAIIVADIPDFNRALSNASVKPLNLFAGI